MPLIPDPVPEREITWRFVQSSGPGGQNVNKVASAAQLRFDVRHSPSLSDTVRARLLSVAGRRVNAEGVLVIMAQRFRSQERNRADALARLNALVAEASVRPEFRVPTRVPKGEKRRRLEGKTHRSGVKTLRKNVVD